MPHASEKDDRVFRIWALVASFALGIIVAVTVLSNVPDLRSSSTDGEQVPDDTVAPTTTGATTTATDSRFEAVRTTEVDDGVFDISNVDDWDAAVALAQPGDTLRLVANINSRVEFRADTDGVDRPGSSGTEGAPIVITALPGVWIDPGDISNNTAALDIRQADFIRVEGVNVRNSQFGIRLVQVRGSALEPSVVVDSTITNIGHSGLAIQAMFETFAPSSHILVEGNQISQTGQLAPRFGEGIYIGIGTVDSVYKDETHDVTVRNNEIFEVTAEAVDIKPGTRDVLVEGNRMFNLAPIDGGAISAHYASSPNPKPDELDNLVIRRNLIWNQNLDGVPGANDWAIWIGHGGVTVEENTIWGLRDSIDARAVRIRALADFGPHPIIVRGNVFWTANGVVAEGEPSGAFNLIAERNLGPNPGIGGTSVPAAYFVGPVPDLGSGGPADAGEGPGSAFEVATG